MSKRRQLTQSLVSIAVVSVIAWLLWRELKDIEPEQIAAALTSLTPRQILLAIFATIGAYLLLASYDALAILHLHVPLGLVKTGLTSFVSYAFNFNLGSLVGAVGIRLRLYTRWGLSKGDAARITIFCALTSWLGYALLAGLVLALMPPEVPGRVGSGMLRTAGVTLTILAGLYVLLCAKRRAPLKVGPWTYRLPGPAVALAQLAVSVVHWSLVSFVVYSLLPSGADLTYADVLAIHLVSAVIALITHVPGGLGVLEGAYILLLTPTLPHATVLGALIAFRIIFYLAPLLAAAFFYVGLELWSRRSSRGAEAVSV